MKPLILLALLLGLSACADIAPFLGITSEDTVKAKTEALQQIGGFFGPLGEIPASIVSLILVSSYGAYQKITEKKRHAKNSSKNVK